MSGINRRDFIAGVGAAIGGTAFPVRAEPASGLWTPRADMPFAVQEIYPAAFWKTVPDAASAKPRSLGVLVNAGGITGGGSGLIGVSGAVTVYDPVGDRWSHGPLLPEPRHHIALVFASGFLFALGGFSADRDGAWRMRADLWRIDSLDEASWRPRAPLPVPQAESVAASLDGFIHVAGGRSPAMSRNREWSDHIDTEKHFAYDPRENRWNERRPLPTARNSAAGAVVDGFLYVLGGRTVSGGNLPDCHVYDGFADRWQPIAPIPKSAQAGAPRGQAGNAAAVWNGKIYMMGGEWFSGDGGVYADVFEYDPRTDKWRAVAPMPRPRHGLGAVALADGIYVCGGASGPSASGTTPFLDRFEI